jgi:hypothetical protein
MRCQPEVSAKLSLYASERILLYPDKIREKIPRFFRSGIKCPMKIIGNCHKDMNDVMVMFEGKEFLLPGDSCEEVFMAFLCPDLVLPKITIGTNFKLWSGDFFAEGEITHIY